MSKDVEYNDPTMDLNKIYLTLISDNDEHSIINFEEQYEKDNIFSIIDSLYDKSFKLIESIELQKDLILLNKSFEKLLVYTNQLKMKQHHLLFVYYCEYFDLDTTVVYEKLNTKLKTIIEICFKRVLERNKLQKLINKQNNGIKITSLFEIKK